MNYKKYIPLKDLANAFTDLLLPPRCPISGLVVDRVGAISPESWKELTFISDPKCTCCGLPFEIDLAPRNAGQPTQELRCAECLSRHRPFESARSVFVYDDGCRGMILAFKHADALHLHTTLCPLLARIAPDYLPADTVIIPVPLHWFRLVKRRYNQAAILSDGLADITGYTHWPDALLRIRSTASQGHKNAKDRHENVKGAFDLNPRYADKIKGKTVLLIDDVFTTGATLEECCHMLKYAGAGSIHILTLARAVKR